MMDIETITSTVYEAGKPFTIAGRSYKRGDIVDVSNLAPHKIAQMLNQRLLRPTGLPASVNTVTQGTS